MPPLILKKSTLLFVTILIYGFMAPLGNLVRFGDQEGSFGVTTVLFFLLVAGGFKVCVNVLYGNITFQAFALLTAWLTVTSLFAAEPITALLNSVSLILYLCGAMLAFHLLSTPERALLFLKSLCLAGLIASMATIVDFFGFLDLPGVNELAISTKTEVGRILQASGVFSRRSAMSAYYSIIITTGLCLSVFATLLSTKLRLFFLLSAFVCIFALALTHNRSGVLAPIFILAFLYLARSANPTRMIANGTAIILLCSITALISILFFPDVLIAYQALLGVGDVASTDDFQQSSDYLRIEFAKHAIFSLANNPFGHGYSLLTGSPSYGEIPIDPHNSVTQIIWGAGVPGIIWLLMMAWRSRNFFLTIFSKSLTSSLEGQVFLASSAALLAFFLNNLVHTSIATGVAWLLLGTVVRLNKSIHQRKVVLRAVKNDLGKEIRK